MAVGEVASANWTTLGRLVMHFDAGREPALAGLPSAGTALELLRLEEEY
ncbi:hypothetical protein [Thermogemmatispora sp.]|jgi:sorbitol-specific phosphotransferase system component IIA